EAVRTVEPVAVVGVAQAAAGIEALEMHDAAVLEREAILEIAPHVVVSCGQRMALAERHRVDEADALLIERFACAERDATRPGRARVLGGGLRRETARVVGDGLIREVHDREQLAVPVEIDIEAAGELPVLEAAQLAEPVVLRVGRVQKIAYALAAAAGLQLDALVAVPAGGRMHLGERLARRPLGRQADYAAGCVAVQGRARAANDLDLVRRAEVDAVDRALAVGQRLGDAVDEDLDAADAEVRARTEAANRHAQILREVETILHE